MFGMVPFRRGTNNIERSGDYFNNIFENFFPEDMFAPVVFKNNNFNVDVKEDENQYTVEADLPGIKKEDITLEYQNNYLTISAKRNNVTEDRNCKITVFCISKLYKKRDDRNEVNGV